MAAQAALESGNGRHAPGNNFFGIKAGKSWAGDTQRLWTTEEVNGQNVRMRQNFRKYASPEDAIQDRIAFMRSHFGKSWNSPDIDTAVANLQHGRYGAYATDSTFAPSTTYAPSMTFHVAGSGNASQDARLATAIAEEVDRTLTKHKPDSFRKSDQQKLGDMAFKLRGAGARQG